MMNVSHPDRAGDEPDAPRPDIEPPSGLPSDADRWVELARSGDGAGFDGLYRWLAGPIRGFAASRGAPDPDDVVNDVFLKAFRSIETFEGDGAGFRAWLFATTRNHLIDLHRHRSRRPRVVTDEVPEQPVAAAEDVALLDLDERTAELLACLTEAQREVIVLRIVADLSLREVADIVDRPITAVKRLQARGLRTLQENVLREVSG